MSAALLLLFILVFAVLLFSGVPVAVTLGSCAVVMLVALDQAPEIAATIGAQRIAGGLDSFTILAIPFFILAGQFMNTGGIARRLIDFARALVGMLPGGLAMVNIFACVLFGAISGSAVAAVAAVGGFLNPVMIRQGYDRGFNVAVNATSGTTGLVIPPSNILIIYSLASGGTSIAALFLAGYIPGILTGLALALVAFVIARKRDYPRDAAVPMAEIARRFVAALPSLALIVIVMGGIVGGFFTPTEASGIAVVYTAILTIFVYREISPRQVYEVILKAARTSAVVLFLVATSLALSWYLAYGYIPQTVSEFLLGISDNPYVILVLINLILLGVGTCMDMAPAVLIFTPIFLPVVTSPEIGLDPIQFGILMVMNLCIGLCTPPVGTALFVGCGVAEARIPQVIRPLLPFLAAMVIVTLLVTFIPALSLWLPSLFAGQ